MIFYRNVLWEYCYVTVLSDKGPDLVVLVPAYEELPRSTHAAPGHKHAEGQRGGMHG